MPERLLQASFKKFFRFSYVEAAERAFLGGFFQKNFRALSFLAEKSVQNRARGGCGVCMGGSGQGCRAATPCRAGLGNLSPAGWLGVVWASWAFSAGPAGAGWYWDTLPGLLLRCWASWQLVRRFPGLGVAAVFGCIAFWAVSRACAAFLCPGMLGYYHTANVR